MPRPSPLSSADPAYVESLYQRYRENPDSVGPDWRAYFSGFEDGGAAKNGASNGADDTGARAHMLIDAYRRYGHLAADLDPLGLQARCDLAEFVPDIAGFHQSDKDRSRHLQKEHRIGVTTLGEMADVLQRTYCGTTGYEIMHVEAAEARAWLIEEIERPPEPLPDLDRRRLLERLIEAEAFEQFLHRRYPGAKRFSGEGVDVQLPVLDQIVAAAAIHGVEDIVVGGLHRGRLNLMANFYGKSVTAVLAEFAGAPAFPDDVDAAGDVTYHLGFSTEKAVAGQTVRLSLLPNPSHLEAIDPVTVGHTRARQDLRTRKHKNSNVFDSTAAVLGLIIHTDAALIAQGVAAEVAQLSALPGYDTGGTIHLVINNQIGFTTEPADARSSTYCTDVAKAVGAPVLHVNADDPEAAIRAAKLAVGYRQRFRRDVYIDLVGYRRHGHNEIDEPRFTQPVTYARIAEHPTIVELYGAHLADDGPAKAVNLYAYKKRYLQSLEDAFEAVGSHKPNRADWLQGSWAGLEPNTDESASPQPVTGLKIEEIQQVGKALTRLPDGFDADDKVTKFVAARRDMVAGRAPVNWACAESLAFAILLAEGVPVRVSGQDSKRGAFSQRHVEVRDRKTGAKHMPLAAVLDGQAPLTFVDSPLSEYAVLGFEYGYSLASPHGLTVWEAQFGDFANGAQIVFDQFLAVGADKWLRLSGLVVLLPHGMEGGGPEHVSGRIERFLQLCAKGNLQVVNCTTPANYFHVLRRQIQSRFRRPLIAMTPKLLLRHSGAVSNLDDFGPSTAFRPVLTTPPAGGRGAKRVVLCSGRIYYDLLAGLRARKSGDCAIVRLEQLYPWPEDDLASALTPFAEAEFIWCQDEPANMGAWTFVDRRLEATLTGLGASKPRPHYVGRLENPSPAADFGEAYKDTQRQIVDQALGE